MGWNGTEYSLFAKIDMFVGGKNEDPNSKKMATAYIAYDCHNQILVSSHVNGIHWHHMITPSYFPSSSSYSVLLPI